MESISGNIIIRLDRKLRIERIFLIPQKWDNFLSNITGLWPANHGIFFFISLF